MRTAEASLLALRLCCDVAPVGLAASVTDAGVGAAMAFAGVRGAVWNVLVNLHDLEDASVAAELRDRCEALLAQARALRDEVDAFVDGRVNSVAPAKG